MPRLNEDLLFFHIGRSGGTSITRKYKVEKQAADNFFENNDYYRWIGIKYFSYRYKLLENQNLVFFSYENILALCQFILGNCLLFLDINFSWAIFSICMSLFGFIVSTFIGTPMIIGRIKIFRQLYIFFLGHVFRNWCGNYKYLYGTSTEGLLLHCTPNTLLKKKLINETDLENAFVVCRNPYSRLVSIYNYNKYPFESFETFVKRLKKTREEFKKSKKEKNEKNIYCHFLLQVDYIFDNEGNQLVHNIFKLEEIKNLQLGDCSKKFLEVFKNLNKRNTRKQKNKNLEDYYKNPEIKELVYSIYKEDFEFFNYQK